MAKMKKISRTKAVEMIGSSAGRMFTVTFMKKDGSSRTINGLCKKDNTTRTGYIRMYSAKDKGYRSVDPRTINLLRINKEEFKVA